MNTKKTTPTSTVQKVLFKIANQSGGPHSAVGKITGLVGHFIDMPLFAAKWTSFIQDRIDVFGSRFVAFDQGIVYTSHAEVKELSNESEQNRGPYFGPVRVYGSDYFLGYFDSATMSDEKYLAKRHFKERMIPDPVQAAADIDRIIAQELNKIALGGKLGLAQELQFMLMRLLHELILQFQMTDEEVADSSRYLANLRMTAFPNLLHRLTFNLLISKNLKHRRALIERYKRAESFAALCEMGAGLSAEEVSQIAFQTIHVGGVFGMTALTASVIGVLATNDELRQQVMAEATAVWDGKWPVEVGDLAQMTLLDHVMWETARLYPPARFVNYMANEGGETIIDGAKCPFHKGTRLMLSLYTANRDPQVFDEPDTFRLDRDFSHVTSWNNHSAARACLGMGLSQALVKRIALQVIFNYTWEVQGALEWEENKFEPAIPKLTLEPFAKRA